MLVAFSPILAIHVRKCVHIIVRDLAVTINISHFGATIDTEVVMLCIKGTAIVVVDGSTIGIAVRDYEVVMKIVYCWYI